MDVDGIILGIALTFFGIAVLLLVYGVVNQ